MPLPKGYRHSSETIEKIRAFHTSPEASLIGPKIAMKLRGRKAPWVTAALKGRKRPPHVVEALRRPQSPESNEKRRVSMKGRTTSAVAMEALRCWNMLRHANAKSGPSLLRRQGGYITWRSAVLKRDNYTCQKCGGAGPRLDAHHSKSWANYPDLRFEVSNGVTLCYKPCHIEENRKQRERENAHSVDL